MFGTPMMRAVALQFPADPVVKANVSSTEAEFLLDVREGVAAGVVGRVRAVPVCVNVEGVAGTRDGDAVNSTLAGLGELAVTAARLTFENRVSRPPRVPPGTSFPIAGRGQLEPHVQVP